MRPPDPLSTAHLEQQLGSDGLDAVLEKIARPLPLIVFHGDRDAIVASANASGLIDHVLAVASPDRHPGTPSAAVTRGQVTGGHAYTRTCYQNPVGAVLAERWIIHQGGHSDHAGKCPAGGRLRLAYCRI